MAKQPAGGNVTLKAARKAFGLNSQQRFADAFEAKALEGGMRLGVSVRQVRRWESAVPPWPTPEYQTVLEALFDCPLSALGFASPDSVDHIDGTPEGRVADRIVRDLQGDGSDVGWRAIPAQADPGLRFERLVAVENAALAIRHYSGGLVPGLLQTFEYACAAIRVYTPGATEDEIVRRATLRVERQQNLAARHDGLRSQSFVLDEAALRNPVGNPGILREQLGSLLVSLSRRPDITVQVLPDEVGVHPGMTGMFAVYDLGGHRAVSCEGLAEDLWSCRPSCFVPYLHAYDRLQMEALGAEESIARIAERLAELEIMHATGGRSPAR